MGAEKDIADYLDKTPSGASISDISKATKHSRSTTSKYLELMKSRNLAEYREVGKAKLWLLANKRKKILIAEDESYIRTLVKVILGDVGYDFVEAKDGKEALDLVNETMPDLIILDLMMPKVDGISVCKQLKSNALTKKIPIMMLTAKREMTDKLIGINAGADDYLTKPFEPRELRVRVRTFFDDDSLRNPITNLPNSEVMMNKIREINKDHEIYQISLKNIDPYKNKYGFSKTEEMIKLTGQIISHVLEKNCDSHIFGHSDGNNFLMGVPAKDTFGVIKTLKDEFKIALPFLYDIDYDSIDLKAKTLLSRNNRKLIKMPIVDLDFNNIQKEELLK